MSSVYNPQADIQTILDAAAAADPASRFALMTTLERYQTQLKVMQQLRTDLATRGALVPAGPKSRKKTMPNPSIAEYDKVASAANQSVQTMLRICMSLGLASGASDEEVEEL